jgi:hypothetical protein
MKWTQPTHAHFGRAISIDLESRVSDLDFTFWQCGVRVRVGLRLPSAQITSRSFMTGNLTIYIYQGGAWLFLDVLVCKDNRCWKLLVDGDCNCIFIDWWFDFKTWTIKQQPAVCHTPLEIGQQPFNTPYVAIVMYFKLRQRLPMLIVLTQGETRYHRHSNPSSLHLPNKS